MLHKDKKDAGYPESDSESSSSEDDSDGQDDSAMVKLLKQQVNLMQAQSATLAQISGDVQGIRSTLKRMRKSTEDNDGEDNGGS